MPGLRLPRRDRTTLVKQEVKQEIRREVKQEIEQEATLDSPAPSTPPPTITLPKRPRVVSSEFSTPGPAAKKSTTISLQRNERGRWVKRSEGDGEAEESYRLIPKATGTLIGRAMDTTLNIYFYKVFRIIRLESRLKS